MGFKDIKDTFQEIATYPQIKENAELLGKILQLQSDMFNLQTENHNLKRSIVELKKREDERGGFMEAYQFDGKKYVLKETPENPKECLCSACWDEKQKRVRLHFSEYDFSETYFCPVCKIELVQQTKQQRYFAEQSIQSNQESDFF